MSYWGIVKRMINDSDIIIEVIDSRFPEESRNSDLERIVKNKGKSLLLVINKSDLISLNKAKKVKSKILEKVVFVSAKKKNWGNKIKNRNWKTFQRKRN